ncbi:MAG TPA: endonuclease/exonuclease/phosphatase family protein [Gemmataceae bacterium]|nr:endonuclease/exonuclease/phosphatase family protein [Gemmataceae bacterium]
MFWNLRGNDTTTWAKRAPSLCTRLTRLATALGIDVLLPESGFNAAEVLDALNGGRPGAYCHPPSNSRRIQLFTRLPESAVIDQFNDSSDGRLTIRRLTTSSNVQVLLAALHFQSQMAWKPDEQALQATVLHQDIVREEDVVGHQRTVLIGDLNMNPFDLGLVGAQALNSVMTRDLARREERTVAGRPYRLFYNPMWGCFGDRTPGPPGTYFYSGSTPFWNIFDQVLLRPILMDRLVELCIVDGDGQDPPLTERGRPNASELSDHLPLLVRLDI